MRKCTIESCNLEVANSSKCRVHYNEYMKRYMLDRYHRRRKEWIEKLGGKCEVCGTTEDLQFDHIIASEKEFSIGSMLNGASELRLKSEMSKCRPLCREHHLEKSLQEGDIKTVEHGGGVSGKENCRCELCAPLKNAYVNNWRRKKRDLKNQCG